MPVLVWEDTAWAATRVALAAALEAIAIEVVVGGHSDEEPLEQEIQSVHSEPPPSLEAGLLPAIVFGDATLDDDWGASEATERYALEAYLMLRHEDAGDAVVLCEAYRQAVKVAIRGAQKAGLATTTIHRLSCSGTGLVRYGGASFWGFRFVLEIAINDADPGFGAG